MMLALYVPCHPVNLYKNKKKSRENISIEKIYKRKKKKKKKKNLYNFL
jgi:hypothetical protein